ncbi:MAG: HU family DNA-binding protein [Bacteroidaceae bacterium]
MATLQTAITMRTIPSGETRLYPNIVSYMNIGNDEIIEHMAQNSGINKTTALNATAALRQIFYNYLLNGHTVKIPQLGTFRLSVKTKAVSDIKDCGVGCVKNVKVVFTPVSDIRKACKSVKFKGVVKDDQQLNIITE